MIGYRVVRFTCVRARSTIRASERPNTLAPLRDARGCGARERVTLLVSFICEGVSKTRPRPRFHHTPQPERAARPPRAPAGVHPAVDEVTRKRSRKRPPLGGYAVRGLYGDRRSLAVERRPVSDLGFAYVSAPRSARLAHDDQIRSDEL